MARTKRLNVEGGDSPPPPSPKRQKVPKSPQAKNKYKPKVKESQSPIEWPKAKGIMIQEPQQTRSKSKTTPEGKGKEKEVPEKEGDVQDYAYRSRLELIVRRFVTEGLIPRKSRHGSTSIQPTQSQGTPGASTSPHPSISQSEEPKSVHPLPTFNVTPIEVDNQTAFDSDFESRSFCLVVYVDLAELKMDYNLDLYPFLGQYESWLSIRVPHCPKIVKLFYFNMKIVDVFD